MAELCRVCKRPESYVGHTRYAMDAHEFEPTGGASTGEGEPKVDNRRIVNSTVISVWVDEETKLVLAEFPKILTGGKTEADAIESLKAIVRMTAHMFNTGQFPPDVKLTPVAAPVSDGPQRDAANGLAHWFLAHWEHINAAGIYDRYPAKRDALRIVEHSKAGVSDGRLEGARLDEIRERCEKATKGPWQTKQHDVGDEEYCWVADEIIVANGRKVVANEGGLAPANQEWQREQINADSEFIAHARTDIPYLLELASSLRAQLDAAKNEIECCDDIRLDQGLTVAIADLQKARSQAESSLREAQRAVEQAAKTLNAGGHKTACGFSGCTCGAVDAFKTERLEFFRLKEQLK